MHVYVRISGLKLSDWLIFYESLLIYDKRKTRSIDCMILPSNIKLNSELVENTIGKEFKD